MAMAGDMTVDDATSHADKKSLWVRRPWCVWLAAGLVLLGAVLNTIYLFNHCRIDLSEDEAHYWEWSRHLDYGYYSKPPGIAWVLWAAEHAGAALGLNGDGSGAALMPVLRMPAVLFGVMSGMLSLFLARRIFRDDRAALAVIVLSAAVPMFAVGSLLITIDSPMYLCWAVTVYCLWRAVELPGTPDGNPGLSRPAQIGRGMWLYAAGACAGVGMLFKPVLVAIPLCAVVAAVADRRDGVIRKTFFSRHALAALVIMLCSQVPVVLWNSQHNWVMFRHISTQGGMGAQAGGGATKTLFEKILLDPLARMGEYVGGQAAGMGGVMFFLLVVAVVVAWMKVRAHGHRLSGANLPTIEAFTPALTVTPGNTGRVRPWIFLLAFTVPLWGFYFIMNLWKGTELNWPAASYFAGMILLAGIFVEGWNAADLKHRGIWRSWGAGAVAVGVLLTAVAMNTHRAYGWMAEKLKPLEGTDAYAKSLWNPRKWDQPIVGKLRGMRERADVVQTVRGAMQKETGQEPLIIGRRYGMSSSLAFYLPGQPFVYSIMSSVGERESQYDLWPGLNQKDAGGTYLFAGRPAIIVATDPDPTTKKVLVEAFERVEEPQRLPVKVDGVVIKEITIYRAWGFRGMPENGGGLY